VDAPDDQLEIKGAGISASLEAGYAIMSGAHGRIEPVAQLIYQRRNFSENIDRFERDYRFGAADSLQARAGLRWSRNVPAGANKALVPWLRVGGGYEFNGRQNLRVGLFDLENNPGGALFLADCGVTLLLGPRASLYAGGIWSQGGNIETLSASAGARFSW
jgi:outer membrane autotransporter protein